MKIAVVGSRGYARLDIVRDLVDTFEPHDIVVSGGARGVDTVAVERAEERGLATEVFLADWDHKGRSAGMLRNIEIVDAVHMVVAFWDMESRGTKDSIVRALKANKPVVVFNPAGKDVSAETTSALRKRFRGARG